MNDKPNAAAKDISLDFEDYLKGAADASNRTRVIMLAMVVASVLAFVSFLNTMNLEIGWIRGSNPNANLQLKSWKLARLERIGDPRSDYVHQKLCGQPCALYADSARTPAPASQETRSVETRTAPSEFVNSANADLRYRQFYAAAARDYVDNAFTVRVPFFGVAFDVNDLGLLVGIGFVTILLLLRFSIRSEIISLRISFKSVRAMSKEPREMLERFYDLLAMRQVFTLPRLKVDKLLIEHHGEEEWSSHEPNWTVWVLRGSLKFICCLPFLVYSLVALHDLRGTAQIGKSIDPDHFMALIVYTCTFWALIFLLTLWCLWKLVQIDLLWDSYWSDISDTPPKGLHYRYIRRIQRRSEKRRLKSSTKLLQK
jgi:hypothetical protein